MSEKTFGKGCRVLILGATSGIAKELAREFARHGFELVLAGRDTAKWKLSPPMRACVTTPKAKL